MAELGIKNNVIALDIMPRDISGHNNTTAFIMADGVYLPFADCSIDIIYCNSILEHVGDWNVQLQMFSEIERVGRKFYVQTPNQHFPIEAHHLVPFFQYLPYSVQQWIGQTILGHYEKVWLLNKKDVQRLADIGDEDEITILEEKILGLTKSFVLYRI